MRRAFRPILLSLATFGALTAVSGCSSFSSHINGTYIPADLADAHAWLGRNLSAQDLRHIRAMKSEGAMIEYHFGIGLSMRNNWRLWAGSRLSRYFNRMGIHHPDDMSGIILYTFWCKLHGKPFELERRVGDYQESWRRTSEPKGRSPKDGAKILWVSECDGLHLGISRSDGSYWRYQYDSGRGIEPATREDAKELDELKETWRRLGTKIENL